MSRYVDSLTTARNPAWESTQAMPEHDCAFIAEVIYIVTASMLGGLIAEGIILLFGSR
jgi:hypothetical protein